MRAPPEAVKMTAGRRSSVARSTVHVIFSPTTEPIDPIMNDGSMTASATGMPASSALPQRTASDLPLRVRARSSVDSYPGKSRGFRSSMPSNHSSNVPSSKTWAIRSSESRR